MGLTSTKPTVLLLGVFHMANPGLDTINTQFDDVLASHRQQEIRECVERLKRFSPTKVAVEQIVDKDNELNEEYQKYRAGTFDLTRDEIHQLAYRIASELGYDRIYAVDWRDISGLKYDPNEWARENQPELYEEIAKEVEQLQLNAESQSVEQLSILELLHGGHDLESAARIHQLYMSAARIGKGKEYVGLDWLMWWYRRNMTIYVNVTRLVTSPEDRILVMFGNGHIYLLNQFFRESGLFNVELADKYLS